VVVPPVALPCSAFQQQIMPSIEQHAVLQHSTASQEQHMPGCEAVAATAPAAVPADDEGDTDSAAAAATEDEEENEKACKASAAAAAAEEEGCGDSAAVTTTAAVAAAAAAHNAGDAGCTPGSHMQPLLEEGLCSIVL
jgi:hypothetical protein